MEVGTDPLDDLALSLNNLSVRLGEMERREEGLAAVEEAVEVRRRLAQANPAPRTRLEWSLA